MILSRSSGVLAGYPDQLSEHAERALIRLGVRLRSNARVTSIDGEGITFRLPNGTESLIATRTVLWAGGVMPSDFTRMLAYRVGSELDGAGRIPVNADLTVGGYDYIYLADDLALAHGPDGSPLPGVCQVAMQQGV